MQKIKRMLFVVSSMAMTLTLLLAPAALADPPASPPPQCVNALMIGDRLVDVAYNLGVLPEYMSVRSWLWPMSNELKNTSQIIGCPNFITNKNVKIVPRLVKSHKVTRIILEKSEVFSLYAPKADPTKVVDLVKDIPGVSVEIVDFTQGVAPAIRQVATLLDRVEEGQKLVKRYEAEMACAKASLPNLGKRVLVLRGTYQKTTGKTFVQAEAPGGYTETFLLTPLGCKNVAKAMVGAEAKSRKGHYALRKLDSLTKANPEVIVLTGDTIAVQVALAKAVQNNPALAQVPAIRNSSIYSLPLHNGSGVIEYPDILMQWAKVLGD